MSPDLLVFGRPHGESLNPMDPAWKNKFPYKNKLSQTESPSGFYRDIFYTQNGFNRD